MSKLELSPEVAQEKFSECKDGEQVSGMYSGVYREGGIIEVDDAAITKEEAQPEAEATEAPPAAPTNPKRNAAVSAALSGNAGMETKY